MEPTDSVSMNPIDHEKWNISWDVVQPKAIALHTKLNLNSITLQAQLTKAAIDIYTLFNDF